jgi:hypothetical protein
MSLDAKDKNILDNRIIQVALFGTIGFFVSTMMDSKDYMTQDHAIQQYQSKSVTSFDMQVLERLKTLELSFQNFEKRDENVNKILSEIQLSIKDIQNGRALILTDRITKQEAIQMGETLRVRIEARLDLLEDDMLKIKYSK